MFTALLRRLRFFSRRARLERELQEEMNDHLQRLTDEKLRSGLPLHEARRRALLEFGNPMLAREASRRSWSLGPLEDWVHDLRYGMRLLRRSPGWSAVALITLALGIGANTAVFSIVYAALLRPLPYPESDRLVIVRQVEQRQPERNVGVSYPELVDWRQHAHSLQQVAAYTNWLEPLVLQAGERPELVRAEFVSADYLRLLGVSPLQGRLFSDEEDAQPRAALLVSEGLWERAFGRDPALLGSSVVLNSVSFEIVGILPRQFRGLSDRSEVWAPLGITGTAIGYAGFNQDRRARWFNVAARLAPGATAATAQQEMAALAARLAEEHPAVRDPTVRLLPLAEYLFRDHRATLLLLLAATGLVLLIACVNVSNLLLARATSRGREVSVRMALGAGRGRLIRQFLAESVLIGLMGGATGVALAFALAPVLVQFSPVQFPSFVRITVHPAVLAASLGVAIATGLLAGIAPALAASRRHELTPTLKGQRSSTAPSGRRFARGLVVAQIALAQVVLVTTGLAVLSFVNLQRENTGFRMDTLTVEMQLTGAGFAQQEAVRQFTRRALEEVQSLPGVQATGLVQPWLPPDSRWGWLRIAAAESAPVAERDFEQAYANFISPGYLEALGVPLLSGRGFEFSDRDEPQRVAIISRSLAERYWPGRSAVGQTIVQFRDEGSLPLEVIGVVPDVRSRGRLAADTQMSDVYLPVLQRAILQEPRTAGLVVRPAAGTSASDLAEPVSRKLRELSPDLALYRVESMAERFSPETGRFRFSAVMMLLFGMLAVVIALVGLYGVISASVASRTQEIGVRVAIGARPRDIALMVLFQGLLLAGIGVVAGLAVSLGAAHTVAGLLYGTTPYAPANLLGIALLLTLMALLACYLPARRASRLDPVSALRAE